LAEVEAVLAGVEAEEVGEVCRTVGVDVCSWEAGVADTNLVDQQGA